MAEKLYIKEEERQTEDNREFFQDQKTLMAGDSGLTNVFGTISMKDNGQINFSNKNNQVKLNRNGHVQTASIRNEVVTNNEDIRTNNFFINKHKLNNKLYDYTDFKRGLHSSIDENEVNQKSGIIGHFCIFGTVLVKAWDQNLQRYVMIRRLANMPMFSPELDM